jgi:hypothetical protein
MRIIGTPYEMTQQQDGRWILRKHGFIVAGPYRTRGEALSVAITLDNDRHSVKV